VIQPRDPRVVNSALHISTHHQWFVEHLEACYAQELNALAYKKEDFQLHQGRVQMLADVLKLFRNAEVDAQRLKP